MSQKGTTSLPRPIDSTLHGVTDYSVGTALMTVFPRLVGIEGTPAARQIRVAGAFHAGYSTLTDYPLGIVKGLPYRAHLAIDALAAVALAATPFVTGQYRKGRGQWVPHVALCVFELASLAMSDPTGKGDYKADVDAIRLVNMEDPIAKVYDTRPAVVRGAAASGDGARAEEAPAP
jgi:hypothetical protein